jgi:ATP adenylyltransferase/5',5'''-P-1,P-4-tetraphosphate phosphorylase II
LKNSHLLFNTSIGVKKPESIRNKQQACPFCERDQLTDLIEVDGPIILLKNKYPVLENAYQTVLIETDDCQGELSTYSKSHLHRLLSFGIRHWLEMEKSGKWNSVIFFKNYGPLSGGTIAHPHMQIVGLNDIDYREKVDQNAFEGIVIEAKEGVQLSLSTKPRVGFYEFNVEMPNSGYVELFGDYVQTAVHYILNNFPFKAASYNVFFHHIHKKIVAKIVPRFVTTPLYIGYGIPQVPNNLDWMAEQVKKMYFSSKLVGGNMD